MKIKYIGIILILLNVLLILSTILIHTKMDLSYKTQMINNKCQFHISNGVCLHSNLLEWLFNIVYVIYSSLVLFGIYLIFFDTKQDLIAKTLFETSKNIKQIKKIEKENYTFEAFLKGFTLDERKILTEIKNQEGIWQSTLRFKLGFSKSTLSLILKDLEKKGHISKIKKGKTFEVYLKS